VIVPFEEPAGAFDFAKRLADHPSIHPYELVVYHSEFIRALKAQSNEKLSVED
jgi:hypothetical protein